MLIFSHLPEAEKSKIMKIKNIFVVVKSSFSHHGVGGSKNVQALAHLFSREKGLCFKQMRENERVRQSEKDKWNFLTLGGITI
jgi:hypothetical protein